MKLKQLQEKRGSLMKQVRETLDLAGTESRALNSDEQSKLSSLEVDIGGIDETINAEVRQMARESQSSPNLSVGERRTVNTFDLGRALRSLAGGNALDGAELEMVQEGEREARAAGVFNNTGICLPTLITRGERRDVTATGTTTTTLDQGGMTIATNKAGLLDDFFNGSIMRSLGATVLEGLVGNLDLPRLTAGTAPAKKAENASADEYTPLTAMLSLTPRRLPAFIDISDQLLLQSSSAI